jgi:hypothetical protein
MQQNLSGDIGKTAGIDSTLSRVWIRDSLQDILAWKR